jgi:osmotically-inducible protein OsmY/uncharacterized protein YrrD
MAPGELEFALAVGAPVTTPDGRFGRVRQVILSPKPWRVVALEIRYGLLARHVAVVPWSQVVDVTDAGVLLRSGRAELAARPDFGPATIRDSVAGGLVVGALAPPAWAGLPPASGSRAQPGRAVELRLGTRVLAIDGRAGYVGALLLAPAGELRHVVVHRWGVPPRSMIVPVGWVRRIDARAVRVAANRAMLGCLPLYRPDRALVSGVQQALWNDEVVRALDCANIEVMVCHGVATLRGYAATPISKARAEWAARAVPGVVHVVNRLVSDSEVVGAVARALAADARTRDLSLSVQARHGVVQLRGTVANAAIRLAAEACAAGVPCVRGVINAVQAPGEAIPIGDLRVVQPAVGQEVYASAGRIGRVVRVIFNPRRRPTAIVVRGRALEAPNTAAQLSAEALSEREREVLIPIDAVANVSDSAVLLNIGMHAVGACQELDPSRFEAPPAGWQPPYPYHAADILVERPAGVAAHITGMVASDRRPGAASVHDMPSWQRLSRGMPVQFRDGNVGTIERIWVDSYHDRMGAIVVRLAAAPHSEAVVPLDRVFLIEDVGVYAAVDAAPIELLPAAEAV